MRTLSEKYEYNKARRDFDDFSFGYCFGVDLYRDYIRANEKSQRITRKYIDTITQSFAQARKDGKRGYPLDATSLRDNGTLCGYRDAANERKRSGKMQK